MNLLTIYDPPQCCSTGVCGADVDQNLVTFAADLDWLQSLGVEVRRINLSQEPMEFISEPIIKALLDEVGNDGLPAIMAAGKLVSKAHYPSRNELAEMAGVDISEGAMSAQVRELVALGAAAAANCEPCLNNHADKARAVGVGEDAMHEAIAIGRKVREASAARLDGDAGNLASASANGCCGGAAKMDENNGKEAASSCC